MWKKCSWMWAPYLTGVLFCYVLNEFQSFALVIILTLMLRIVCLGIEEDRKTVLSDIYNVYLFCINLGKLIIKIC